MGSFIADNIELKPVAPFRVAGPDAAVFQAWADYKARRATYRATPDELLVKTAGLEELLTEDINEAEQRIFALPATTLEGLAIKLRMQFLNEDISRDQYEAVLNGWLPTRDSLDSLTAQEALSPLLDIERMIKRPSTAARARPTMADPVIREAWAAFVSAERAFDLSERGDDEDEAREMEVLSQARAQFLSVPITSLEGVAVRLRHMLDDGILSRSLSTLIRDGAPLCADQFAQVPTAAAVDILNAVEAMIAKPVTDMAIQQDIAVAAPPLHPIETRLRAFEFNAGSTEADDDEREHQFEEWCDLTDQLIRLPGAAVTKLICLVQRMEMGNLADAPRGDVQDYQLAVSALRDLQEATPTPHSGADLDARKRRERHRAQQDVPKALAAE